MHRLPRCMRPTCTRLSRRLWKTCWQTLMSLSLSLLKVVVKSTWQLLRPLRLLLAFAVAAPCVAAQLACFPATAGDPVAAQVLLLKRGVSSCGGHAAAAAAAAVACATCRTVNIGFTGCVANAWAQPDSMISSILVQASTTLCRSMEIWDATQMLLMSVFTASRNDCNLLSQHVT